jgi:hypothetical protein
MFGNIRARRKRKKEKRIKNEQNQFSEAQKAGNTGTEPDEYRKLQQQAAEASKPGLQDIEQSRPEYLKESISEVGQDVQGLTPFQRRQLQESASSQINKDVGNYSRQLASSAGARGVRGGAAAAQQMNLQNNALDARRQFERDIGEKDIDIAMQKLAAALAMTEGKVANKLGAQTQAQDFIEAEKERKRQAASAQLYNKYYSKV